jgi:hypothetical protein
VTGDPGPGPGSIWLYASAFALMLAGGAVLVVTSIGSLQSTRLLWLSAGLSYAAVVFAVLSLVLPVERR